MGYRATRHRDGTYTLHGVPVFFSHSTDDGHAVDREWLQVAAAKHRKRETGWAPDGHDGPYYAPVLVGHSVDKDGRPQQTAPGGLLRVRGVAERTYEGERKHALIADLLKIPARVYARIKRGELPFVSAEVDDFDNPELYAVALLDRVPHFRAPILAVDEEVSETEPTRTTTVYSARRRVPVAIYQARGRRVRAIYALSGGALPMDDSIQQKLIAALTAAIAGAVQQVMATPAQASAAESMPPGDALAAEAAPAEETMPGVDDLPLGDEGEGEPDGDEMAPADGDEDDLETYCDDMPEGEVSDRRGYSAELAKLQGRLDRMEAERLANVAIKTAESKLRKLGVYNATAAKRLRTYAAQGPQALSAYVDAMTEMAPHLPPTGDWSGEQTELPPHLARAAKADAVIATYAAHGPRAMAAAQALGNEYDNFARAGRAPRMDRGAYVQLHMERNLARLAAGEV